jgi:hypothetical protein
MKGHRFASTTKSIIFISVVSLAIALSVRPALSAGKWVDTGKKTAASPSSTAEPNAEASPSAAKKIKKKVKAALNKVNPLRLARDREFKKAAAVFPDFCKDWERKLHDREVNNANHIAWSLKDGWQTGTYTGYSTVQKCECHQSTDGYSIGKVTYDEFQYFVTGKTTDEAKHAKPKVTDSTATTELFRWDKNKWFY